MSISESLEPVNVTLHGKRDFAGVINLRRWFTSNERGEYPGFSGCAQYNHKDLYKREAGEWESELVMGHVTLEARGWNTARKGSQAKECKKPLETENGREIGSPCKTLEGSHPRWHLEFRLLTCRTVW